MRKNIVAGNWKMNKTFSEAEALMCDILDGLDKINEPLADVIICPPALYLEMGVDLVRETPVCIGAQNMSQFVSGAYTGEISAGMLQSMEVQYCILGHSERRKYFAENDEQLAKKVDSALANDIWPIFCCGEELAEREAGNHFNVVKGQIENALFHLTPEQFSNVVIAYEPIWAIGTGVTASPEQAEEMHEFIRGLVAGKYGKAVADETSILYGGSCNAKNANELFAKPDIDGGLIGGASLVADDFLTIIKSF
ncbi:MAG: triose-phosphate isomerase [Bacteroidota bacterium]|nr:triose-phosphate isomerase [Bacteroidota bacterium]